MDNPFNKKKVREHFLQIRKAIPQDRRAKAAIDLLARLKPLIDSTTGPILSFATIGSEIDTTPLNQYLEAQNRLLLPFPSVAPALIFVPGVAFDAHGNRLGFGQGHYDRYLQNITAPTYGIGFTDQLCSSEIPTEFFDVALHSLVLV